MKSINILLLLLLFATTIGAQQILMHPSGVVTCLDHDTSPPLRDLPLIEPMPVSGEGEEHVVPNFNFLAKVYEDENAAGLAREYDPVVQDEPGDLPPNSTIVNINGLGNNNWVAPPDPNLDVGPNHVFMTVNLSFAIYSKTGALLYGPAGLMTLWQGFVNWTGDGDPIVLYDPLADRWLVSQFAFPNYPNGPGYELLAISQTSDPLGAWHRYKFEFADMPDYPKFAVWPDGYYMSANNYSFTTGNFLGASAIVLERDSMLTGNTARMVYFHPSPVIKPILPADLDGPAPPSGTPGYFMLVKEAPAGSGGDQLNIFQVQVDWDEVATSTFTGPQVLSTAPLDLNMCNGNRDCIPQAGTTRKIDALGGGLMHRLQYRNFGTHQVLVTNNTVDVDGTDHAGIRWYELRNAGSGWSIYQQGSYAPDADHRWMASVAMDGQQNIAMGYSVSGTAIYPSIRATGRKANDPLGLMTFMEEPVVNGGGYQSLSESRWGDYSMLALDPVDDETFWYTGEYYPQTGNSNWMTRIASFKISTLQVGTGDHQPLAQETNLLMGNYPNPFKAATAIRYRLESMDHVILKVFDQLGREVATLVDEMEGPGERSMVFDAGSLPEGIYFCRLKVGSSLETMKMAVSR